MTNKTLAQLKADPSVWKSADVANGVQRSLRLLTNASGRYVRVQLQGPQTFLTLAEVQVFAR